MKLLQYTKQYYEQEDIIIIIIITIVEHILATGISPSDMRDMGVLGINVTHGETHGCIGY